jgi:hypothetical protein
MEKYDFLADALQTNVINYLKDWDYNDLHELGYFLATNYMNTPPNEKQLEFIDEFISRPKWIIFDDEFIQNNAKYFVSSKDTKMLVHELSGYVLHQCNNRFGIAITRLEVAKSNLKVLKLSLRAETFGILYDNSVKLKVKKAIAYKKILEMLIKYGIFTPEELENYE